MNEERNIEQSRRQGKTESQQDGKSESRQDAKTESLPRPIAGQKEEMGDELEIVKRESSNVNEATKDSHLTESVGQETPEINTSAIKEMEVHHHPHIDSHLHGKKKFKEYFLEFLMIFLAVTLGFFAENIREKIADNNKEREYMESVVQDLKSDTTEMAYAIAGWDKSNSNADSILIYLKKDLSPSTVNVLYNLLNRDFFHFNLFKYNDKTIQELKSSGDFRLIRDKDITDSIMAFDVDMKYILLMEQDIKDFMMDSKNMESKIFDFSQLNGNTDNYAQIHGNTALLLLNLQTPEMQSNGTLLTTDKETIAEYYNKLYTFHKISRYHTYLFREDKKKATLLLEQIQKHYHLKDE
jgi:hypothetical protein